MGRLVTRGPKTGKAKESLDMFFALRDRLPENVALHGNIARILYFTGRKKEAMYYLEIENDSLKSEELQEMLDEIKKEVSNETDLTMHFDEIEVDVPEDIDITDWEAYSRFLEFGDEE